MLNKTLFSAILSAMNDSRLSKSRYDESRGSKPGDNLYEHSLSPGIAEAAKALPQQLIDKFPEILKVYLQTQAKQAHSQSFPKKGILHVHEKVYSLVSFLGKGDAGAAYLAKSDGESYIIKFFYDAENVDLNLEEYKTILIQGVPIIKILDHDRNQGVLVMEGKVGIPVDFLLQTELSKISEEEATVLLNIFLNFKRAHDLKGMHVSNVAIHPTTCGLFITDIF